MSTLNNVRSSGAMFGFNGAAAHGARLATGTFEAATVRVAALAFGIVAFLANLAPSAGQVALPPTVVAAVKLALAVVECNDGSQRSYRTGVVVASNDVRSFVIVQERLGPGVGPGVLVKCHAPLVHFGDDPTHAYTAQELNPLLFGEMKIMPTLTVMYSSYFVLAVDRSVARVATFAAAPPQPSQTVDVVGFEFTSGSAPGTLPKVLAAPAPFREMSRSNNESVFASSASVETAIVVDPQTGNIFGIAGNAANPLFPDLQRTYQLAGTEDIAAMLQQMPEPAALGLSRLSQQQLVAQRVTSTVALPYFLRWSDNKSDYLGWAVVLGATATKTVLAAPGIRYNTHTGDGEPFVLVHGRDGGARMVPASVMAVDTTGMVFISIPRIDVALPTFDAAPSGPMTVAVPQLFGLCTWTLPAPLPDDCPLRINFVPISPPRVDYPTEIPLSIDIYHASAGAPIIDPATGDVVALGGTVAIPMALVALKLAPLHVGITLSLGK